MGAVVPDGKNNHVAAWVTKIDKLGRVYGWKEDEKMCIMRMRLEGVARWWFQFLDSYDVTWSEWKAALESACPRQFDFAALLAGMMVLVKENGVRPSKNPGRGCNLLHHTGVSLTSEGPCLHP